jgi:hypothetical protein
MSQNRAIYRAAQSALDALSAERDALRIANNTLRVLLRRHIELCEFGDVNETTEALGWGELIRESKFAVGMPVAEKAEPAKGCIESVPVQATRTMTVEDRVAAIAAAKALLDADARNDGHAIAMEKGRLFNAAGFWDESGDDPTKMVYYPDGDCFLWNCCTCWTAALEWSKVTP